MRRKEKKEEERVTLHIYLTLNYKPFFLLLVLIYNFLKLHVFSKKKIFNLTFH